MGNSEFVLTIFGALAQEESANTFKSVKFGKKMNAEKGSVHNIVYGYDKTIGDYFKLEISKLEAEVKSSNFLHQKGKGFLKLWKLKHDRLEFSRNLRYYDTSRLLYFTMAKNNVRSGQCDGIKDYMYSG